MSEPNKSNIKAWLEHYLSHYLSLSKEDRHEFRCKVQQARLRSESIINGRRVGKTNLMERLLEAIDETIDPTDVVDGNNNEQSTENKQL